MKTIFFGTQPYDRESFDRINADYGIRIKYHRSHLNIDNVPPVSYTHLRAHET